MSLYLPGDPRETLPGEIEYPLDVVERTVAVTLTQRVLVTVTVKVAVPDGLTCNATDADAIRLAKRYIGVAHGTIGHPERPMTLPKVDAVRFMPARPQRWMEAAHNACADITPGADEHGERVPFVQLDGWADGEEDVEVIEEVTRQDRDEMADNDAADDWYDARCER